MNIRQQLLKKHSRANSDQIQAHLLRTPAAIVELMACFLSDEMVVAQRAAQVVGNLGRHQPECLEPWWEEMIEAASRPVHDAIPRNVSRYFSQLELPIPKELEKKAVQLFSRLSTDPAIPVAIAVFSMQFVADRSQEYPKHATAIAASIESRMESASPGFQNRGRKILKQLAQR